MKMKTQLQSKLYFRINQLTSSVSKETLVSINGKKINVLVDNVTIQ